MALGIPGLGSLPTINVTGILSGAFKFFFLIVIVLIIAAGAFYWIHRMKKKALFNKKIHWFEEVNGFTIPITQDMACELTVPNTNVKVFYIESKDMYLPRPTIRIGKDSYWLGIKNNREIVNFRLKNINERTGEVALDYDHTDMRYAESNLREIIKRNYRDKSIVWWKEYKEVIAFVIIIFVGSLAFFFLLSKMATLIDKIGQLIELANNAVSTAQAGNAGSGVVTVK